MSYTWPVRIFEGEGEGMYTGVTVGPGGKGKIFNELIGEVRMRVRERDEQRTGRSGDSYGSLGQLTARRTSLDFSSKAICGMIPATAS